MTLVAAVGTIRKPFVARTVAGRAMADRIAAHLDALEAESTRAQAQ